MPDDVVDELIIHGPPEKCREHLQRYVDNGVTTPVIGLMPLGVDAQQAARDLALVAFTALLSRPNIPACPPAPTCPTCPSCPGAAATPPTPVVRVDSGASESGVSWLTILQVLVAVAQLLFCLRIYRWYHCADRAVDDAPKESGPEVGVCEVLGGARSAPATPSRHRRTARGVLGWDEEHRRPGSA